MKLEPNKYYTYQYEDTIILTRTYEKEEGGNIFAWDVLKLQGDEEILDEEWDIQEILYKENISLLECYDSKEDFENKNSDNEKLGELSINSEIEKSWNHYRRTQRLIYIETDEIDEYDFDLHYAEKSLEHLTTLVKALIVREELGKK